MDTLAEDLSFEAKVSNENVRRKNVLITYFILLQTVKAIRIQAADKPIRGCVFVFKSIHFTGVVCVVLVSRTSFPLLSVKLFCFLLLTYE